MARAYVAKFAEAVYVLHAFRKKTQRTARSDVELASRRYGEIANNESRITKSSGNVFVDLGFPADEVAVLTLRAELMVRCAS